MGPNKRLPEPSECDHCNSKNILFKENVVKGGNGKRYNCWVCKDCDALVSCHYRTRIPLGYMADASTRALRKDLHLCFDTLWQQGYMTREEAYCWLAIKLLKTRDETHVSQFSKQELKDAMVHCKKELDLQERVKERRQLKDSEKRIKSYERHRKHIRIRKSTESVKFHR